MAEMNALFVKDAEEYYRTMMTEDVLSWNLRCVRVSSANVRNVFPELPARSDEHFARTVAGIAQFLAPSDSGPGRAKIVVWAHNSHIGDARATDMGRRRGKKHPLSASHQYLVPKCPPAGEISIGQQCREIFGDDKVFNIGFLTNRGAGSLLNAQSVRSWVSFVLMPTCLQ